MARPSFPLWVLLEPWLPREQKGSGNHMGLAHLSYVLLLARLLLASCFLPDTWENGSLIIMCTCRTFPVDFSTIGGPVAWVLLAVLLINLKTCLPGCNFSLMPSAPWSFDAMYRLALFLALYLLFVSEVCSREQKEGSDQDGLCLSYWRIHMGQQIFLRAWRTFQV